MSRYKVEGNWYVGRTRSHDGVQVSIETADVVDTKTGVKYSDGAKRVTVDGKPRRGKGGTVPFVGDHAHDQVTELFYKISEEVARS